MFINLESLPIFFSDIGSYTVVYKTCHDLMDFKEGFLNFSLNIYASNMIITNENKSNTGLERYSSMYVDVKDFVCLKMMQLKGGSEMKFFHLNAIKPLS